MQEPSLNIPLPGRVAQPESRGRQAARVPAETGHEVTLSLCVSSIAVWLMQRALRNALGPQVDVCAGTVEYRKNRTHFLINTTMSELADVMNAVVSTLPEAEFGPVRSTR